MQRLVKNEESLREYCYENNRAWKDELYDSAVRKATKTLSTDEKYINAFPALQEGMTDKAIVSAFIQMMNLTAFYRYVDNNVFDPETLG